MTQTALERGKDITYTIDYLKRALSETSKNKLFNPDEPQGCFGRQADPFLSELDAQLRTTAVKAINAKISALEREFRGL